MLSAATQQRVPQAVDTARPRSACASAIVSPALGPHQLGQAPDSRASASPARGAGRRTSTRAAGRRSGRTCQRAPVFRSANMKANAVVRRQTPCLRPRWPADAPAPPRCPTARDGCRCRWCARASRRNRSGSVRPRAAPPRATRRREPASRQRQRRRKARKPRADHMHRAPGGSCAQCPRHQNRP